jgi:hypothetical protein
MLRRRVAIVRLERLYGGGSTAHTAAMLHIALDMRFLGVSMARPHPARDAPGAPPRRCPGGARRAMRTMLPAGTIVDRRARIRSLWALTGVLIALTLALGAPGGGG